MDGTFGRGGHSRLILEQLGGRGRLIAFDRDPSALAVGQAISDVRFCMVHNSFLQIKAGLAAIECGLGGRGASGFGQYLHRNLKKRCVDFQLSPGWAARYADGPDDRADRRAMAGECQYQKRIR